MASPSQDAKPVIGILSIGDMGFGVAKLLIDQGYRVYTSSIGRSQHTMERIKTANINDLPSDEELVAIVDIILSIVPPRDALATASRIVTASKTSAKLRRDRNPDKSTRIVYVDLNAVSPRTMSQIAALIDESGAEVTSPDSGLMKRLSRTLSIGAKNSELVGETGPSIVLTLLDGAIIGGPPSKQNRQGWEVPSIPVSGPEGLLTLDLMSVLNMKQISDKIGTASTLKACFASMNKGFTALAAMAFATAETAGVLSELRSQMEHLFPDMLKRAEAGLTGMPPKAYRWVDEMRQIGDTFNDVGGLKMGKETYSGIAEMYRFIAEDTDLGQEKIGKRKRGTTSDDVGSAIRDGVDKKVKKKSQGGEQKLDLAWRSSWS